MNVPMIGGTRDFGRVGARLLLERGDNVTIYSRGSSRYYDFFSRPSVYVPSIEKARLHFGLKTTPFEKWMAESVAWYMEQTDLKDSPHYDRRDEEVDLCRRWREQYGRLVEDFTSRR